MNGRPAAERKNNIISNSCNHAQINYYFHFKMICLVARFCRVGNFQTLPGFSAAQPTSRFPWFLDQNDVPEGKRLIAQKPHLERKIFLFCTVQQLIPHTPDLENTRERCVKTTTFVGRMVFSISP